VRILAILATLLGLVLQGTGLAASVQRCQTRVQCTMCDEGDPAPEVCCCVPLAPNATLQALPTPPPQVAALLVQGCVSPAPAVASRPSSRVSAPARPALLGARSGRAPPSPSVRSLS
jgi:hypothetical protein